MAAHEQVLDSIGLRLLCRHYPRLVFVPWLQHPGQHFFFRAWERHYSEIFSVLKTTLYRESLHSLYKTPLFCISTNRVCHFQTRTDLPVASWTRAMDGEERTFPKHFLRWIAKIQAVEVTADWEGLLPLIELLIETSLGTQVTSKKLKRPEPALNNH